MSQNEPSAGAYRAAKKICKQYGIGGLNLGAVAAIIDRETGLKELREACKAAQSLNDHVNSWPSPDDRGGWESVEAFGNRSIELWNELRSALKLAQGGPTP